MIGAGTIINPIIKIISTAAILGAVYVFIVKPTLNTTEKAIQSGTEQSARAQQQAAQRAEEIQIDVARQRLSGYQSSLAGNWPEAAHYARDCEREAKGDLDRLQRCIEKVQRLTTAVQSDRSFALSYADSLDARGDDGDAARVEDCVHRAGFRVAAMQRCEELADDLLFG